MAVELRWYEIEAWATAQIAASLIALEKSEVGGEQHRGRISALRDLLVLPTKDAPEPDARKMQSPFPGFSDGPTTY